MLEGVSPGELGHRPTRIPYYSTTAKIRTAEGEEQDARSLSDCPFDEGLVIGAL
jgi:hypothetical protein